MIPVYTYKSKIIAFFHAHLTLYICILYDITSSSTMYSEYFKTTNEKKKKSLIIFYVYCIVVCTIRMILNGRTPGLFPVLITSRRRYRRRGERLYFTLCSPMCSNPAEYILAAGYSTTFDYIYGQLPIGLISIYHNFHLIRKIIPYRSRWVRVCFIPTDDGCLMINNFYPRF